MSRDEMAHDPTSELLSALLKLMQSLTVTDLIRVLEFVNDIVTHRQRAETT